MIAISALSLVLFCYIPVATGQDALTLAVITGNSDHNSLRGQVQLVRISPNEGRGSVRSQEERARCRERVLAQHPVSGAFIAGAYVAKGDGDVYGGFGAAVERRASNRSGSLLTCGNIGDARTDYCHTYDPVEDTWSESIQMMSGGRAQAAQIWVDQEKWWVTGGVGRRRVDSATTELFDLNSNSFWEGPRLPEPLADHCVSKFNDSHFILVGGDSQPLFGSGGLSGRAWLFDMRGKTFMELPSLQTARKAPACGLVRRPDGSSIVVVAGGVVSDTQDTYTRSSEVFDAMEWSWRSGPDLPSALAASAGLEFGTTFLLVGGYLDSGDEDDRSSSVYSRRIYELELYRTWWSALFRPSTYYERWTERPERLAHGTAGCPMFWVPNDWC